MGSFSPSFGDHYFPLIFLGDRRLRSGVITIVLPLLLLIINDIRPASSASSVDSPQPRDIKFYKSCVPEIFKALDTFSDSDLQKEPKITRIRRSNGTSVFYPFKKPFKGKHLFYWSPSRTWKNLTSRVDSLVVALPNHEKSPFGWMSGTFFALRRAKSTVKERMTHYHAMVVYARKDANGILLEWDRWSDNYGKAMEGKKAYTKALDINPVIMETVLCAYGTCSCSACKKCRKKQDEFDPNRGRGRQESSTINGKEFNSNLLKDADMMFSSGKGKSVKHASSNAYANSIARGSLNETAHQKQVNRARGKGQGGNSSAWAQTHKGSAMAKSVANTQGVSLAASKAELNTVSDARSADGLARALSLANQGFAQSASETEDGALESMASKSGKSELSNYDNYDDIEQDGGVDEEELDAEKLFKETDQAFDMASKRTHFVRLIAKGDISADMCSRENEMVTEMDRLELAALLKGAIGEEEVRKQKKANRIGMRKAVLYKDPLRYVLDIDGGVNKSIIVSGNTTGYYIKRPKCCDDIFTDQNSEIKKLLVAMDQECGGQLQDLISHMEKYKVDQFKKLMQTKKISSSQQPDLVPMLLLQMYKNKVNLTTSIELIDKLFNYATSEKASLSAALLVNSAFYASILGDLHKVKLYKGLVDNAQNVWTGVVLEYKKCLGSGGGGGDGGGDGATGGGGGTGGKGKSKKSKDDKNSPDCSEQFKERLEIEMNLALGTYLFLKQAENRFITTVNMESPADAFVSFLQLHNLDIAKQVYCKSRRILKKS